MKSDSELQRDVMHELARDPRIDATAIGVSSHHGVVTLSGAVSSWTEKHVAEQGYVARSSKPWRATSLVRRIGS